MARASGRLPNAIARGDLRIRSCRRSPALDANRSHMMNSTKGKLHFLGHVAEMLNVAQHRIDHAIRVRRVCDPPIARGRRLFSLDDVLKLRAHFRKGNEPSSE